MTRLLAEFADVDGLAEAVRRTRKAGIAVIDAFTPFPAKEVIEAMGIERQRINWLGYAGMAAGAAFGWWMQWFANVDFPLNIGGRPLLATPSFMVLTIEFSMLGAAAFMFFGMLILNRLPRLHHPVFDAPRFHLVSADRCFLLVDAADDPARRFVEDLHPVSIAEVEP